MCHKDRERKEEIDRPDNTVSLLRQSDHFQGINVLKKFTETLPAGVRKLARTLFHMTVSSTIEHNLNALKDLFQYQGFDAKEILETLLERAERSQVTGKIVIKIKGRDVEFNKGPDFPNDMALLTMLFCIRGTNWNKISKKLDESAKELLQVKVDMYQILSTQPKGGYGRKDVTLARLAAVFPHWVCEFHRRGQGRSLVDFNRFSRFRIRVPNFMKHNLLPPLVPKTVHGESVMKYCYCYAYYMDMRINPK